MDDDTVTIPIDVGPQYSSGDPSLIPQGFCARVRNMLLRPKRIETRPPFVYDSLMSITGLANFDDTTNKVSRMLSFDSSQRLYEKGTSGEAHSASLGTVGGTRLTSLTNYRGKAYGMMETSGLPAAAFSFDGTNINTAPFNSAVQGRVGIAYLDRLFIIYPRVTITPLNAIAASYRFDDPARWTSTTITPRVIGNTGQAKLYRIYPNDTVTFPQTINGINGAGIPQCTFAASNVDTVHRWRLDYRGTDPTQSIVLRLVPLHTADFLRINGAPYAFGSTIIQAGAVYRVTVAGTTAGAPPVFSGVVGTTVADGTVTWTAERSQQLGNATAIVGPPSPSGDWSTLTVEFTVPWRIATTGVIPSIRLGADDSTPPTAIVGVDVAFTDGLADGDPRKKNRGSQITTGDFHYPFVNTETDTTATVDMNSVIWSDILQPTRVRASATYELWEVPGYPTAAALLGGRLLVFKRNAFWIFAGNRDTESLDVIPIRQENKKEGVGCIGPRAHDSLDNDIYFIGEDGVYRFSLDGGEPEEIGGDAMREEIIARGANWVESQTTYNQPILRANPRDRELYVYTQKGTIYVYNIARKGWTTIDVIAADGGAAVEVADMIFNPNTRKLYVAFGGHGLARLDWSAAAANDTINNSAVTLPVTKDLVTRPIEAFSPRQDATVDNIGVFHTATASQVGQELTAHVSFDRGNSYPFSDTVTLDISIPRNQIDLFESEPSITVKLSHVGKAGKEIWSVSKLDAELIPFGGEWPQTKPAPVRSVQ